MAKRLPPHNVEAEEAVLGALIIDPDALYSVSDFLKPTDFYLGKNGTAYQAILDLNAEGTGVDAITLGNRLSSMTNIPINDCMSWIVGVINVTPSSVGVENYARVVEEKSIRRRMIQVASKVNKLAWDEGEGLLREQLDEAETLMFEVRGERSKDGVSKPKDYVGEYLDHFEKLRDNERKVLGLPTGFTDLDRMLSGLQVPYQYILAGRPGMGKSALAVNIATHLVTNHNKRILFFALEMSKLQIINRMLSSITGISGEQVKRPWSMTDEGNRLVYEALGRMSDGYLFIDDTESQSPMDIRTKSMRVYAECGLDLVIVDHLHLMRPDRNMNRPDLEIGEMTQSLAALGKHLNTPILTLAQLNRDVEKRQNKRPMMADLRESGRIEENAFAIMFLYRDEYYNDVSERPNIAEVIVAKHREGPTGVIDLYWNPRTVTFKNLIRQEIMF